MGRKGRAALKAVPTLGHLANVQGGPGIKPRAFAFSHQASLDLIRSQFILLFALQSRSNATIQNPKSTTIDAANVECISCQVAIQTQESAHLDWVMTQHREL